MQAHIKIHHNDNDNDNDAQQFVVLQENYVLLAQRRTLRWEMHLFVVLLCLGSVIKSLLYHQGTPDRRDRRSRVSSSSSSRFGKLTYSLVVSSAQDAICPAERLVMNINGNLS